MQDASPPTFLATDNEKAKHKLRTIWATVIDDLEVYWLADEMTGSVSASLEKCTRNYDAESDIKAAEFLHQFIELFTGPLEHQLNAFFQGILEKYLVGDDDEFRAYVELGCRVNLSDIVNSC